LCERASSGLQAQLATSHQHVMQALGREKAEMPVSWAAAMQAEVPPAAVFSCLMTGCCMLMTDHESVKAILML
jgi:hypothetical protein